MNVKPGDKVWVFHFEDLIEIIVLEVTEIQGRQHVMWRGFASHDFYATRMDALTDRLRFLSEAVIHAKNLKDSENPLESSKWIPSFVYAAEVAERTRKIFAQEIEEYERNRQIDDRQDHSEH